MPTAIHARGEAECHISIEAERRVLHFPYSTWQGNALTSDYKEFPLTVCAHDETSDLCHLFKKNHVLNVLSFSFTAVSIGRNESNNLFWFLLSASICA